MNTETILREALDIIGSATPYTWVANGEQKESGAWSKRAAAFVKKHRDFKPDKPPWTSDRPAAGKWWLALDPRNRAKPLMFEVEVGLGIIVFAGDFWLSTDLRLAGALWLPREVPGDPFAKGGGE